MGASASTTLRFLLLGQDQLSKPVKGAGEETERTGSKLRSFGRTAAVGLAAAGAAAVAFATSSADKFKTVTTESRQLQRAMGGTIEEASKYRYAANMSGVETGTFLKSMQLLDKKLIAAKGSTSAQADMTAKLGVNFLTATGQVRPMNELLPKIADRFANMQDGPEKSALAMQLFGKAGSQMIPFLDKGSSGIAELTAKAQQMGLVIGKDDVDALGASKKAQREWQAALDGVKVQLSGAVLPAMTTFTGVLNTALIPLVKQAAEFIKSNSDSFAGLATALATVLPLAGQFATLALNLLVPALTATSTFLKDNWSWVKYFAIALGVLWGVVRGYTALVALGTVLSGLPAKAIAAKGALLATGDAMVSSKAKVGGFFATYGAGLGIIGGTAAVAYLGGRAIADLVDKGSGAAFVFDKLGGSLGNLQSALVNAKGSSHDAAAQWAEAAIKASGLDTKAAAAGITIDELTKAVLGGRDGAGQLAQKWRELGAPSDSTLVKLLALGAGYEQTSAATKKNADMTKAATGATKDNSAATAQQRDALGRTTAQVKSQDAAVKSLTDSMKLLSGDKINARQAELSFKDGLAQATQQVKDNGASLSSNTEKGRANQKWLLDQLTSLQQVASAQLTAGASTDTVTAKLHSNEDALRKAAAAAGMNKSQVDKLITSFGQLPASKSTDINSNASSVAGDVRGLKSEINGLHDKTVNITAVTRIRNKSGVATGVIFGGGSTQTRANAQGTGFSPGGRTLVGEFGPEIVDLPTGSKVNTADTSMSRARMAAADGGGDTYVIQLNGILADEPSVRRAVGVALENHLNSGATVTYRRGALQEV